MVMVSGKTLGSKRPLFADFSLSPPEEMVGGGGTTLRELVECVVRNEVAEFRKRQSDRRLIRVLTAREIEHGVEAGKIESGGSEIEPQQVDEDAAVGVALQAFEDGIYLVAIDGQQCRDLDAQVFLQPDSSVTFIRLTLLAGG